MNHPHHHPSPEQPSPAIPETKPAYHLRIPKPNWQVTALILIAIIAGFQTIQLIRLKSSVTAKAAVATTAAPATSSDSGLQSQVGGC
jgi:hypothetical protein